MVYYFFLSVYSIIIIVLAWRTWKKTNEAIFLVGTAILYYWSLLGAWFVVFDHHTDRLGMEFGLHYYYLFERLFPVRVDSDYLAAIHLYAWFVIAIQLTVLLFAKPKDPCSLVGVAPIHICHYKLIAFCICAAMVSCLLVWKEILTAAKFGQSVYVVTRHQPGRFFTWHQLLNQVAVISLYIGLIACISGGRSRLIAGDRKRKILYIYFAAVVLLESYLLLLGNKREMLFGGVLGILFYIHNVNGRVNRKVVLLFVAVIALPLFFNDGMRIYSPEFLTMYFDVSGLTFNPDMDIIYSAFSMKGTAASFLFSNEMFCSHFSMYGILHNDVPATWGNSMLSLVASLVPKVFWPGRPEAVYEYYVRQVHAMPGQGYTIHHAAGWYLNFGLAGVIAGALMLGRIWVAFYNKLIAITAEKHRFLKILFIIGSAAFTAQLPALIRSGPEGYKAVVFEALLLPALVMFAAGSRFAVKGRS